MASGGRWPSGAVGGARGRRLRHRFVDEAQIAGQLQHPGVTPVYEMGHLPDQQPYFTIKLVRETLSRLLKDRPDPTHDRLRF